MARGGSPKLTPGESVIVLAGVLALIFSFLPWYRVSGGAEVTAWAPGLFPFASLPPLIGIVMALQIALDRLAQMSMGRGLADFTWAQVHLVLALFALVLALCYAIVDKVAVRFGLGYYVVFACSAALVVGAIMLRGERRRGGLGSI